MVLVSTKLSGNVDLELWRRSHQCCDLAVMKADRITVYGEPGLTRLDEWPYHAARRDAAFL